jgi:hypothetical protein
MTENHHDHPGVLTTRTVHDVHRRATALLVDATTEDVAADVLAEFGNFLVETLRHHHECEDTDLWPLLTAAQPGLSGALDELSREHERLDDVLDEVERAVDCGGPARRSAIQLRDLVHEHLSHEEPVLFPAIEAHLSHDVWAEFARRTVAKRPPDGAHLMIGLLDEVGPPRAVELILSETPVEHRVEFPAMRERAVATLSALRRSSGLVSGDVSSAQTSVPDVWADQRAATTRRMSRAT